LAWRFHDEMCLTLWRIPKVRSVGFDPLVDILTKRAAVGATRRRRRRSESYRIGVNLGDG
jgi:hypothetical protein